MATLYKDLNGKLYVFPSDLAEGINVDVNGEVYNIQDTGAGVWDILRGIKFPDASLTPAASYLLDTYTSFVAISTRQLSSTVTNCMRVRRSSDDAETDIGFSSNWVDEAALLSHCGAGDGFVVTMYDQSGNGVNFTQSVAVYQPRIVNSGVVEKQNDKPMLSSRGTTSNHAISMVTANTAFGISAPFTTFNVSTNSSDGFGNAYVWVTGAFVRSNYNATRYQISDGITVLSSSSGDTPINSQNLLTCLFNDASSIIRCNGTEDATGSSGSPAIGTTTLRIMNDANAGSDGCAEFQELVMMAGDQTANFTDIESNINTAFAIY